jgi:hypothetical protein
LREVRGVGRVVTKGKSKRAKVKKEGRIQKTEQRTQSEEGFGQMKVLLVGGGEREDAIAWRIAQSKKLSKLYITPGNPGTARWGENAVINAEDLESDKSFAKQVMRSNSDLFWGIGCGIISCGFWI